MESGIVQFREDQAALDDLRKEGINPNEFGRQAFEEAYRRFAVDRKMKFLAEVRDRIGKEMKKQGVSRIDFAALIRRDRDSR